MTSSITPDIAGLRALSHPVRLRMLGLLRTEGPATATSLAQRLGLNTGATSYHLRQLAQHGFIEEDPERGTGRDRWWRAAHDATRTDFREEGTSDEDVEAYLPPSRCCTATGCAPRSPSCGSSPRSGARSATLSDWEIPLTPAGADDLVQALVRVIEETEDTDDGGRGALLGQPQRLPAARAPWGTEVASARDRRGHPPGARSSVA